MFVFYKKKNNLFRDSVCFGTQCEKDGRVALYNFCCCLFYKYTIFFVVLQPKMWIDKERETEIEDSVYVFVCAIFHI